MKIRQANVDDLDAIYTLEVLCFSDPYPKELLRLLLSLYPELFLVIESNSKIVGYVAGIVRADGYGHIVSLCVHPMYRRRGLGTKLINTIEDVFGRVFNICRYRLEVRISNASAISLYKKLGYSIVGITQKYYPNGEDAYIMIKNACREHIEGKTT